MGDPEEIKNLSLCVKSVFQTFHQYYTFLENKTKLKISSSIMKALPRLNDQLDHHSDLQELLLPLSQNLKGSKIIMANLLACLMRRKHAYKSSGGLHATKPRCFLAI